MNENDIRKYAQLMNELGLTPLELKYVSIGDRVKKGQVLCIVEAMKLMNEITAEEDGVISEVCVTNGQLVEYGTELFRIKR